MQVDEDTTLVQQPAQHASVLPVQSNWLRKIIGWPHLAFLMLLLGALGLHLYHLGHTFIAPWDEAFHAVVAAHLEQHPLLPTLYEYGVLLPKTFTDWGSTHVWLHIPPLGMEISAFSMWLLGNTPLALRLPGVLYIAIGMFATYQIGLRLFNPVTGLIGAIFIGYGPYVLLMSQGYVFGDLTDTPLLALTPLTVLALVYAYQSGRIRWLTIAGILQGACYLTKSSLGLAPTGIMLVMFAADLVFPAEEGWHKVGWRGLAAFFTPLIAIIGLYNLYAYEISPSVYRGENALWRYALRHSSDAWGRPDDYHFTMYLFALYGAALALLLIGGLVVLTVFAIKNKSRRDLLLVSWIVVFYLPLSLIVTKTVPYTISVVPAFGLLLGRIGSLALGTRKAHWRILGLGSLLSAALIAILLTFNWQGPLGWQGPFDFNPTVATPQGFFPYTLWHRVLPFLFELGLTAIFGCGLWFLYSWRKRGNSKRIMTMAIVTLTLLILGGYWLQYDVRVVARTPDAPEAWQAIGTFLRQNTAANTTILLDNKGAVGVNENNRLVLMFWANRDVYLASMQPGAVCPMAQTAEQAGSPVVVITTQAFPGKPIGMVDGWSLYKPNCSAAKGP